MGPAGIDRGSASVTREEFEEGLHPELLDGLVEVRALIAELAEHDPELAALSTAMLDAVAAVRDRVAALRDLRDAKRS
jgi:hypothetical protein